MTVSTDKENKPAEAATKAKVRVSVKPKRVIVAPVDPVTPVAAVVVAEEAPPPPTVVVKVKRKKITLPPKDAPATNATESIAAPAVAASPIAAPTAKAGRPSSRLAQLTVPSIAQTVASTAAKASYAPATSTEVDTSVIHPAIPKDDKLANNWKSVEPENLSDAELLAMPDSEYMNKVQLAAFRLKLVQLKRGILDNAGETSEHLREDNSVVPDPADRATIEEEHALELRTRDRERKLLKKIEQSIARIDSGDYGYCDETGEPIGVGRLLARPTATLSLEAQQRRELRQKMCGN